MKTHYFVGGKQPGLLAVLLWFGFATILGNAQVPDPAVAILAKELAPKGWILFSARTPAGDYDLFLARPDGSHARNITQTPQVSEFGGRFSPSGRQMLFRRMPKGEPINHDLWGAIGALFLANADGSNPVQIAGPGELPWASWGKDEELVACLYKRLGKIRIVHLKTRQVVKELPRQGIFQQMYWSADGQQLCGTANVSGQDWNILSLDINSGQPTLLTRNLNCTADWFQMNPRRVIYSHRTPGLATDYGWTMLMQATSDGKNRTLIYGERGRHIYYGCTSPDDQYVIFSRPETDGGTDAHLAIVRLADTPIIVPDNYRELRALYPQAKNGPVLRLPMTGFEPHWTYAELGPK